MRSIKKQKGIALLTAILIIAIVSVSATYLIDSGHTVLRKAQQRIENQQILSLSNAVESYAIDLLYRDQYFDVFASNKPVSRSPGLAAERTNPLGYDPFNDSLFESWSKAQLPEFIKPLLGNQYLDQNVLYMTDLNRYFNINNLHFSNATDNAKIAFTNNLKIFKHLMNQIMGSEVDTGRLVNDIIDWVDHDNDSRSEILLTEDDMYRRSGTSFRPSNRPISNIGELKHVLNMTPKILDKLSQYTVALPVYVINRAPIKLAFSPEVQGAIGKSRLDEPALTTINVNTCSLELLKSLFALYDMEALASLAFSYQGEFQPNVIGRGNGRDFIEYYISAIDSNDTITNPDKERFLKREIALVASEFSQYFLIESFFQKRSGPSLNIETMVYKDSKRNELNFNSRPTAIQRQFDWLPLAQSSNQNENKDGG